jgi:aspartyl-tRNA synthetase
MIKAGAISMHPYRTHTCNELNKKYIGKTVRLSGWLHNKRDHGGILFIDLRDHYGITQVVVYPKASFQKELAHLHKETVLQVEGQVELRSEDNLNPKIPTGEIEVDVQSYKVLGRCESLPFSVFPEEQAPEETRLKHRYIDLRRSYLQKNIVLRSKVISAIRKYMTEQGFNEIQTPILTASSPEGARDYLVPSRLHPGKFYALPQAPQIYKQLLMVAGFDKYFQIAPCFRDEDARATRSPGEFYQLDIEMSFATQEDIFHVVEEVLHKVFTEYTDWKVSAPPFPRIPYREAMLKYGTDKPDLRNPLEIIDVSEIFRTSNFNAFKNIVAKGGVVRAILVKNIAGRPRSFFDRMVAFARELGSHGLAYLVYDQNSVKGPIAKFLTEEEMEKLSSQCEAQPNDVVFFICNTIKEAEYLAGEIRIKLAEELDLSEKNACRFCWIVDYPMYEWNEEQRCIEFSHNPFSMPQGGMEALENKEPLDILAYQYDIVCNGIELSSGAIRNHDPEIMYKAFEIGGYTKEEVGTQFSALIHAFRHGAPPHGGIAPGIDRIVMLLARETNIREVIAFPMNQKAQEPMMDSPREVSDKQLRELHLRISRLNTIKTES